MFFFYLFIFLYPVKYTGFFLLFFFALLFFSLTKSFLFIYLLNIFISVGVLSFKFSVFFINCLHNCFTLAGNGMPGKVIRKPKCITCLHFVTQIIKLFFPLQPFSNKQTNWQTYISSLAMQSFKGEYCYIRRELMICEKYFRHKTRNYINNKI